MANSKIIIGCMSWGKWGKKFSTKEQEQLIKFCVENGLNTFDHADIYGDYTTENEFGKALHNLQLKRSAVHLISKCGIQLIGETRNNKIKHYNYAKEYIIYSAEQSLKNLKTEYLDCFLLHRPSPLMRPDEISEAIYLLKKSGKVNTFGVSNFTTSQINLINQQTKIEVNQIEFSLTQNKAMTDGSLDVMLQHSIQPMAWSPLGNYFKDQNSKTERIKGVLEPLKEKYKASEDSLLLAWILKHPSQISPVIGTTNKTRILNAKKALEINLELEDWFILLEASEGKQVP